MIPLQNIVAWGAIVPWADNRQIEQDLIISRALVDIFSDDLLKSELRFRGGTALNKLHFPAPLRYSEDIDLVRASSGPIGPILDQLRVVLEPWLGQARFDQSQVAPKLKFRIDAEHGDGVKIRLKVEINTREIEAFDPVENYTFNVENPWFTGECQRRSKTTPFAGAKVHQFESFGRSKSAPLGRLADVWSDWCTRIWIKPVSTWRCA